MNSAALREIPAPLALLLLLVLFFLPARPASARVELRFLETRTLPALGLQLRILSNSREVPLPAVQAHAYVMQAGTNSTDVDLFTPRELWIAEQQGAEWIDSFGNRLRVAQVRTPLPGPFARAHILPGEYDAALAPPKSPEAWSLLDLERWVSDFAAIPGARSQRPPGTPARFADCIQFTFPAPAEKSLAYAFRFPPSPRATSSASVDWFVVLFQLGPETELAAAQQAIRARFLQYITQATEPAASPSTRTSPRSRPDETEPEKSPEFLASRRQVAQSVANLKDWWYLESDHYITLSNLKPTERSNVRELQANVETLRRMFIQWLPPRVPITAVSVIRIPATEQEYVQYVGPEMAWSGGIWMPTRKELVIRPLHARGSRDQREQMLSTAYHEAFHQYCFYALNRLDTAPWFAEGEAALFETIDLSNRGVQVREDPNKLALLIPLLDDPLFTLAKLLPLSYAEFYAANSDRTRVNHYVLAWALNYYLRLGVDQHSPYAGLLDRYVEELWQSSDPAQATVKTFANVNMEQLQRDFRVFWQSAGRRSSAQRNRIEFGKP